VYSDFYEHKVNNTEEKMTPSKSTTSEECKNRQKRQMTLSKEKQIHSQETTRKGTQTLPEKRQQTLSNDETNNANQIRTEDLKIRKSRHPFIREIKLIHSENVYGHHWNRRH
jgi:hypothetical protein